MACRLAASIPSSDAIALILLRPPLLAAPDAQGATVPRSTIEFSAIAAGGNTACALEAASGLPVCWGCKEDERAAVAQLSCKRPEDGCIRAWLSSKGGKTQQSVWILGTSTPDRPMSDRRLAPDRPRVDFRTAPDRPKMDSGSTSNRPKIDPRLA